MRPAEKEHSVPRHVAIIMDGNGRWARRRSLTRTKGHAEGAKSVRAVVRECARLGVSELTLYAFSTENWRRPPAEVRFLMGLLRRFLASERRELMENNIRLRVIGRLTELSDSLRKQLEKTVAATAGNSGMVLRLALNYGGRQEIMDAAAKWAADARTGRAEASGLTEEEFARCLYDESMSDPDLLIRTGGEIRLSNFLLWQASYAELYFTATCWPEFREESLAAAFHEYGRRERRFGGVRAGRAAKTATATASVRRG